MFACSIARYHKTTGTVWSRMCFLSWKQRGSWFGFSSNTERMIDWLKFSAIERKAAKCFFLNHLKKKHTHNLWIVFSIGHSKTIHSMVTREAPPNTKHISTAPTPVLYGDRQSQVALSKHHTGLLSVYLPCPNLCLWTCSGVPPLPFHLISQYIDLVACVCWWRAAHLV